VLVGETTEAPWAVEREAHVIEANVGGLAP
jgi:hypothetical protein